MAAALDVIKRAMRMVGIIAESETPDAEQAAAALGMLNGMLASWEGEGIRLGLPPLALADTIPLPATHDDAIAYGLAVAIAAEYGRDVRPAVAARAESTFRALQTAYAYAPEMACETALLINWRYRRRFW